MVFKIGYNPGSLINTEQMLRFSKKADEQGAHSIWIPESWGREAFSSLGAISQVTKEAKLGTAIVSIFSRTPATLGMAATTMDLLSNNRMIIGLGASTPILVEDWHGQKFNKPLSRMREYVQCLRGIDSGDKITFKGKFYSVNNFKLLYRPSRKDIPIYLAAVNQKMIELACNTSNGVLLYLKPYEELQNLVQRLKIKVDDKFEIACIFICAISNKNPEEARARAAKTLAFYISVGRYYNQYLKTTIFKEEVNAISSEYQINGLDSSARLISDKMLDALTISGNSEQALHSLERFTSTGITLPIIQFNPVGEIDSSIMEVLNTFNG